MIPEIGLMIGCYIVAKLVYISGTDDATPVVKGLSAIAILDHQNQDRIDSDEGVAIGDRRPRSGRSGHSRWA